MANAYDFYRIQLDNACGIKAKKKFKVRASYVSICETIIEAENQQEAYDMALSLDGGEFDSRLQNEDWQIDDVQQIDEV